MRLLVIDGNSIANRAFYGIKLLTTKDGRYTNAIFGFLNIMNSLLRECEPDEVAVAFDLKHHRRPRQPAAGERDHHRAAGHQRHGPQQNGDHGSGCHPRKVRH